MPVSVQNLYDSSISTADVKRGPRTRSRTRCRIGTASTTRHPPADLEKFPIERSIFAMSQRFVSTTWTLITRSSDEAVDSTLWFMLSRVMRIWPAIGLCLLTLKRIYRSHTGEEDVVADSYTGHVRQIRTARHVEQRIDRLDRRTRQSGVRHRTPEQCTRSCLSYPREMCSAHGARGRPLTARREQCEHP
jgi:hypothetical protein